MESLPEIANAVASLLFSEAAKEGGKSIGKGVTEKLRQLMLLVRQKFEGAKNVSFLEQAQNQPDDNNIAIVKAVLITHMLNDESFVNQLRQMVQEIAGGAAAHQQAFVGITAESIRLQTDIIQETRGNGPTQQEVAKDLVVHGPLDFTGNITQIRK